MKLLTQAIEHNLGCLVAMFLVSCVQPIEFDVPSAQEQTVIEGVITDESPPYTVKIFKGLSLNSDSLKPIPVEDAEVTLYDDKGAEEDLVEIEAGIYETSGIIQGKVGDSYFIRVKTPDGKIFESEPEMIRPVGYVEEIKFEYEARTEVKELYEIKKDVFNIYVDSYAGQGESNYVRWRMTGTYKAITFPELNMTEVPPYSPYKNPYPCSGYILTEGPLGSGGLLVQVGACTCCTCWSRQYESLPRLSETERVRNNQFRNVKVGEVPINNATFHEKYLVEVEQMSLTRTAYEFFKLIRDQKESGSNIFQPPYGEIIGNIKKVNTDDPVIGLFWATSVSRKSTFLYPEDVPYLLTPINDYTRPCYELYPNSTTEKPAQWD